MPSEAGKLSAKCSHCGHLLAYQASDVQTFKMPPSPLSGGGYTYVSCPKCHGRVVLSMWMS